MLGLCEALTIISIHALLAESDPGSLTQLLERKYFYPRSPCGERPLDRCNGQGPDDFYPRSPCGERPKAQDEYKDTVTISIHALLAESDIYCHLSGTSYSNFYPRSPCGERRSPCIIWSNIFLFLSTLSLRRATGFDSGTYVPAEISIHALLAESD